VKTTSLQKRIAKLGANAPRIVETWIDEGDGILRHQDGRSMTQAEFKAAFPDAIEIRFKIFDSDNELS
jgi:hypothetical protein